MLSGSEKKNRPLKIGITGGIGSGKTVVTRIFSILNVPIYYADDRAKWILENDPVVKEGLLLLFGSEAFGPQGLNRKYISSQVFTDQKKLEKLNALVHPEVGKDFDRWTNSHLTKDYVLKEAALLFESGSFKLLDKVIMVFCPDELRVTRVLKRDPHRTEEEVRRIMAKQMSEKEKMEKSDFIIYNDDSKLLLPQVLELDKQIRKLL